MNDNFIINIGSKAKLKRVKEYIDLVFKRIFPRFKIIVLQDISEHFLEKQESDNTIWKPLTQRYANFKMSYKFGMPKGTDDAPTDPFSTDTNIFTGNLRRASVQTIPKEEFGPGRGKLTFTVNQLIPYAYDVQIQRRYFWISKRARNKMTRIVREELSSMLDFINVESKNA